MSMTSIASAAAASDKATGYLSLLLLAGLVLLLAALSRSPELASLETPTSGHAADPVQDPRGHARAAREQEIDKRFQQAVMMLHAGQYEYAITALHRVNALAPRMPEAYVNMGYALLGLKRYAAARDFFQTAIDLRPYQANAYWGLAASLEGLNDLPGALGAMRAYIHLSPSDPNSDNYVQHTRTTNKEKKNTQQRGPLPPEEAEFLARGGKQWADRNKPDVDAPAQGLRELYVAPLPR